MSCLSINFNKVHSAFTVEAWRISHDSGGRININRTRLRIHPGAAVFPAVSGVPLPSFSKAAVDSSSSKEPGQSMVIVGKLANIEAENTDELEPLHSERLLNAICVAYLVVHLFTNMCRCLHNTHTHTTYTHTEAQAHFIVAQHGHSSDNRMNAILSH